MHGDGADDVALGIVADTVAQGLGACTRCAFHGWFVCITNGVHATEFVVIGVCEIRHSSVPPTL
jgi:hypothetical protein